MEAPACVIWASGPDRPVKKMCPVCAYTGEHLLDSRVQTSLTPSWTSSDQWSPTQRADGDEGLAGGRVQPDGLHQIEVQEAESESTADIWQMMFTQQHPGHTHQDRPQVEQDPEGHLEDRETVLLHRIRDQFVTMLNNTCKPWIHDFCVRHVMSLGTKDQAPRKCTSVEPKLT